MNSKTFAILAPTYKNEKIFKNYWPLENLQQNEIIIKNNNLFEVKDVDGAAFIINKETFDDKIMDENFFLYFENTDMCLNVRKKAIKYLR